MSQDAAGCSRNPRLRQAGPVPAVPDRFRCALCGRAGTPADVATGWSMSSPPRPTGSSGAGGDRVTALCPECARRSLRDTEARLDP
jgi:hypothetical protein